MLFFRAFFIYQVGVISAFTALFLYLVGIVLIVMITIFTTVFTTVYLIIYTVYRALLGFLNFFLYKRSEQGGQMGCSQKKRKGGMKNESYCKVCC